MTVWKAREATIKLSTGTVSPGTGAAIDTLFTGSAEAIVTDVTISPPTLEIEKVDCIGATSDFQNQYKDKKSVGIATVAGTAIFDGGTGGPFWELIAGYGTDINSTHDRFQIGNGTTDKTRKVGAVLVNWDDSTNETSVVMNEFEITKVGDQKATGTDGYFEFDFEGMCLAKDFYAEWKRS